MGIRFLLGVTTGTLAFSTLLSAQSLEQRVKALEGKVAALEAKIAACHCDPPSTDVSWETNDINDNPATQKQTKELPFSPKTAVVSLFEIRNIGGVGGKQAIKPERTVTLVQGGAADIPMECTLMGGPGAWQMALNGANLTLTSIKCVYPKGYRGAFKIVLTP